MVLVAEILLQPRAFVVVDFVADELMPDSLSVHLSRPTDRLVREFLKVVAEVRRRFDGGIESPSVGVVTFNLQQRALIESLLRDTEDPRIIKALDEDPEGLFVKNLENVQGDERDVILFSTGFSKNDKGYLPLNFGPLNRAGGERRLNVAVTRARRQVIVFSSFSPAELRAEETSSVGIKHLRSYLDLAEHGTGALPYDGRRTIAVDLHREEIADALRRALAMDRPERVRRWQALFETVQREDVVAWREAFVNALSGQATKTRPALVM